MGVDKGQWICKGCRKSNNVKITKCQECGLKKGFGDIKELMNNEWN